MYGGTEWVALSKGQILLRGTRDNRLINHDQPRPAGTQQVDDMPLNITPVNTQQVKNISNNIYFLKSENIVKTHLSNNKSINCDNSTFSLF